MKSTASYRVRVMRVHQMRMSQRKKEEEQSPRGGHKSHPLAKRKTMKKRK